MKLREIPSNIYSFFGSVFGYMLLFFNVIGDVLLFRDFRAMSRQGKTMSFIMFPIALLLLPFYLVMVTLSRVIEIRYNRRRKKL